MNAKILPAIFSAIIFSSCSSAYKTAQTPDDLYYSPAKEVTVRNESEKEKRKEIKKEEVIQEDTYTSLDDRYIRMKIANRRWSTLDDYAYWNDSRYSSSCNCTCNTVNFVWFEGRYYPIRSYGYNTFNNPFSPYGSYGNQYYSWNNPHYYPINYVKTVTPARPSRSLVETYKNNTYDNKNRSVFDKGRTIYSSEQPSDRGSLLKRVFSSSGTEVDRASRTFETNSSTNSRSSNSNSTTTTNSNAGGNSNGYNSTGTSTQTSRPPRKQ
jgi:hypothetical protein